MNEPQIRSLKEITGKIAAEIAAARHGQDLGLLPVNSLLGEIEARIEDGPAPEPVLGAIRFARRLVEGVFDGPGVFTASVLTRFNEWTGWMHRALEDMSKLPPVPEGWDQAAPVPEAEAALEAASQPVSGIPGSSDEPTLTITAGADDELLREFINESEEHLQNIEQGLLVLEENPADADTINTIFRAFHTFKGGSGFLQLHAILNLAHELESLLDQVRQNRLPACNAVINLILDGGDSLKLFIIEIDARLSGRSTGPILVPTLELLARIRAVLNGGVPDGTPADLPAGPSAPSAPSARAAGNGAANPPASVSAVKVNTAKLDSLVDLVGELVISQSLVVQNRALVAVQDEQLMRTLAQLGRITKELQRTAMSLRMVPIRSTFQKMNRLVRDTAARMSKQVVLVMDGEETEIDRTLVEELSDPLIHMIRNAIDHGIEMPAVRQQRGKAPQGVISLKAFYQGGNIVIEIRDDGNGIDKARLLAKAVESGIVQADADLAEGEILNLIFAAGLSTAEKVTDISGRGVGMDVVRRNIEKLRGKVEIQSTPGQGSIFSIRLPLTLAIIDGLIVGVGEHRYILPTLSVCESFRPTPGMIISVQGRGEMIRVRGRLQPVLRLYDHLGIKPASTDPAQSIAVLVEAGEGARCVLVDQLIGKQEVVIKSLGETFQQNRALAGAAILGDGRVGLILDPHALVDLTPEVPARAA